MREEDYGAAVRNCLYRKRGDGEGSQPGASVTSAAEKSAVLIIAPSSTFSGPKQQNLLNRTRSAGDNNVAKTYARECGK
jgi:hypothetical protein